MIVSYPIIEKIGYNFGVKIAVNFIQNLDKFYLCLPTQLADDLPPMCPVLKDRVLKYPMCPVLKVQWCTYLVFCDREPGQLAKTPDILY